MITSFLSVCVENDNFGDVRPKATWLAFTKIVLLCLFRLFTVLHFIGKSFLNLFGFTSVAKKYVCGNKEEFVGGEQNRLDGDDAFVRETESLLNLFSRAWRC